MFKIPLFLLFLQIGFNAALNNRAYSKHQQIEHYEHSEKSDLGYRWGVNDENSDSEYDSSQSDEEYDFEPQRRNALRYKTRPKLETAVDRINANKYANDSSSSLRSHPNYNRSYSGPPSLREAKARKFHKKEYEDSQTSLEGSKYKNASRLEEQPSSLEPLSPLFEQLNNSSGQNHKGNSFSDDASPLDKFYAAFRSNSQNKRRNYRKEYSSNNLNTRKSSDGLSRGHKPGLKVSHKLINNRPLKRRVNRKKYKLFPNDDDTNGQLTFLRESSLEELNLESPSLRSRDQDRPNNRKSNSKNYLTLALSPHNKDFSKLLTDTIDELYLVPVNFRRTGSSNYKFNRRENDNLSAEEDNLSNLSDTSLVIPNSEIPLLRSSEPAHKKIKTNLKEHMINQAAHKELFDDDIANVLRPYQEGKSRINSSDTEHLRHDIQHPGDDILRPDTNNSVKGPASLELKSKSQQRGPEDKDNNEHTTDILTLEDPWIDTQNSNKKQNNTKLRSHDQNGSNENTRDVLPLEYKWIDTLSSKKMQNNTKLRSHDQNENDKNTMNVLPFEYPWIDTKYSNKKQNKTTLRSHDKEESDKNTRDVLPLEYPWIDTLSSNRKKNKSKLRSYGQNERFEETTNVLPLQYPWIDTLSSNKKQNNTKFRRHDQNGSNENTMDVLPLEYPWLDTLSSKRKEIKSKLRSHDKTVKDSTDVLPLQYRWNDALKHNGSIPQKDSLRDQTPNRKSRLDKLSRKKTTPKPISVHPYLRNRKNKKHSDYFRRSYDRFNDGLRLQRILNTPRSNRRVEDNQNLEVLPIAKESENHKPKNFDPYEGSNAVITFPSDRSADRSSLRRVMDSPPLLTTMERPNRN